MHLRALALLTLLSGCATTSHADALRARCANATDAPPNQDAPPPSDSNAEDSGWVCVAFDIHLDGSVQNVRVVDSNPKGRFDEASVRAVSKSRYAPNRPRRDAVVVLRYQLDTAEPDAP